MGKDQVTKPVDRITRLRLESELIMYTRVAVLVLLFCRSFSTPCMTHEENQAALGQFYAQLTPDCRAEQPAFFLQDSTGSKLPSTSAECRTQGQECKATGILDVTYSCVNTGSEDVCQSDEAKILIDKENTEDIGADLCFRTVCANPNDMKAFLTIIHLQDSHTSCVNAERELKAQGAEGKAKLTFVDKSEYSISCAL